MQHLYQHVVQNVRVCATNTSSRTHPNSLRDKISNIFGVGLETADRMLKADALISFMQDIGINLICIVMMQRS